MQKKFLKLICIIFIIVALGFNGVSLATNEEIEEEEEISETVEELPHEEAVSSTGGTSNTSTTTQTTYTPKVSNPTASYSATPTIPEANLTLNNILNCILIAVGVVIILLAIAILIRLK